MLRFQITGQTELAKVLQGLPSRVRVEVAMDAMSKAVQPVVDAAKALAPVGDTGALRESIGFAVRQYKKGRITFGVVGARRGFGVPDPGSSTGMTEPANYAHLVEYGHAVAGDAGNYVEAQPFLRPAWDATAPTVLALLGQELGRGIAAEADRLAAKNMSKAARTRARAAKFLRK